MSNCMSHYVHALCHGAAGCRVLAGYRTGDCCVKTPVCVEMLDFAFAQFCFFVQGCVKYWLTLTLVPTVIFPFPDRSVLAVTI